MCWGDEVNESGFVVAGGEMVSALPLQNLSCTPRFYITSVGSEEVLIMEIKEYLKRANWKSIKQTEEDLDQLFLLKPSTEMFQKL